VAEVAVHAAGNWWRGAGCQLVALRSRRPLLALLSEQSGESSETGAHKRGLPAPQRSDALEPSPSRRFAQPPCKPHNNRLHCRFLPVSLPTHS
jgi:hypothetical protein